MEWHPHPGPTALPRDRIELSPLLAREKGRKEGSKERRKDRLKEGRKEGSRRRHLADLSGNRSCDASFSCSSAATPPLCHPPCLRVRTQLCSQVHPGTRAMDDLTAAIQERRPPSTKGILMKAVPTLRRLLIPWTTSRPDNLQARGDHEGTVTYPREQSCICRFFVVLLL